MPRFALDAQIFLPAGYDNGTVTFVYRNDAGGLSYTYPGGPGTLAAEFAVGLRDVRVDGVSIIDTMSTEIYRIDWGAGRTTVIAEFAYVAGGESLTASVPLSGTALPDLTRGGAEVFAELRSVIDFGGPLTGGRFGPDKVIPFATAFGTELAPEVIQGGGAANTLAGTAGADVIVGAGGGDQLSGRGGQDTILSGEGRDVARGGGGADAITGGGGNDRLFGGGGGDRILGGEGRDRIKGGAGDDALDGDAGRDVLFGGAGDDTLDGDIGNDLLYGGAGSDTFFFNGNDGDSRVMDFARAEDMLLLHPQLLDGLTSGRDIARRFSAVVEGDTVFDFGAITVTLEGVALGPRALGPTIEVLEAV